MRKQSTRLCGEYGHTNGKIAGKKSTRDICHNPKNEKKRSDEQKKGMNTFSGQLRAAVHQLNKN